jgi:type I restriction enzyme M protein
MGDVMTTDLQDFSRPLFAAADQLWTNSALRPDQYAQPVLALIALRQMEAKFEAVHAELAPLYTGRLKPKPSDYQARGAIFLPENARFSKLLSLPGTANLGSELNAAMNGIRQGRRHQVDAEDPADDPTVGRDLGHRLRYADRRE